ncbi:DUF2867 domain-containing protein [Blastococcus sp. CT_GayMR16]|uniref:DUF2867 domain-containing protein n=1 Tax=Blastococcus sp. CT_GayMR16 TaxID=2559607 RepID=UPI0010739C0D|nr:DUF2867 domain-containing protein [Blastococcus sp. CT_GayMR16]TFV87022.1 DUF2867 domain-containing protein [Blastococcus sp. CT_GayMR16]
MGDRSVRAAPDPLSGNRRPDYADAFEIGTSEPDARTAEQWARCALEEAPVAVRWTIQIAHRYLLRFRLGPHPSREHVLGWRIVATEPDLIRVEASSPLLDAVIVGRRVDPTCTRLTTSLFYVRPAAARAVWTLVGPLHRRIAPYLLSRAAPSGRRGSAEAVR